MPNGNPPYQAFALAFVLAQIAFTWLGVGAANPAERERGKYLVALAGCSDCHTPGALRGKPDMSRYLGGSDVGFEVPGLGIFVGPNLTPDEDTGLGKWTTAEVVRALTTGKTPSGRVLAPAMPWEAFSKLTRPDALAIAAYLRSLKPVRNQVPGPFGPTEKTPVFVMSVLSPDVFNRLARSDARPNESR